MITILIEPEMGPAVLPVVAGEAVDPDAVRRVPNLAAAILGGVTGAGHQAIRPAPVAAVGQGDVAGATKALRDGLAANPNDVNLKKILKDFRGSRRRN